MDTKTTRSAELTGIKLTRVSEMIQDAARTLFKEHGLSAPQYNVLRILRGAGQDGLNCHQISERMIKRVPDITRLLDRLEARRLVSRQRSQQDRRVVMARISSSGRKLLDKIDTPLDRQVQGHFRGFETSELRTLDRFLDRLLGDGNE